MPPRKISVRARAALMVCALLFCIVVLCAGCASNPFAMQTLGTQDVMEIQHPGDEKTPPAARAQVADAKPVDALPTLEPPIVVAPPDPRSPPAPTQNAAPLPDGGADPRQLAALIDEVQSLGALDPEAQRALLNNLKQCDPKLWPQMVRQFKAALSYRKQMAATPQGATKPDSSIPTATLVSAVATLADNATASSQNPAERNPPKQIAPSKTDTPPADAKPAKPIATVVTNSAAPDAKSEKSAAKPVFQSAAAAAIAPAAAAPASSTPDAWQSQLTASILELESQNAGGGTTPADIERQINLRLLYLAAGRRDDAMRPISGMSPEQQQFWTKELFGLATYRDAAKEPDLQRRATEAAMHLREAAAQLGDLAAPVVRNLAFCKEVTSFGVYKKFPNYEFASGDEALLYCELENLKAAATDRGYHTAVKGTYAVLDGHGTRIAEQEFPVSDDFCANPRRDFFILYHIWIPKQIAAGPYTLQLTIEDTQSNKIGQSTVTFRVR